MEEALFFAIGFDQCDLLVGASRQLQVTQGFLVNREDAASCPVLRRHVCDGGAISQRKRRQTWAIKFNELSYNAVLAQHLGDG